MKLFFRQNQLLCLIFLFLVFIFYHVTTNSQSFVPPAILHTHANFSRIKAEIPTGEKTWTSVYNIFKAGVWPVLNQSDFFVADFNIATIAVFGQDDITCKKIIQLPEGPESIKDLHI